MEERLGGRRGCEGVDENIERSGDGMASSQQPAAVPALLNASVQVQVDQTPGG